MIYQCVHYIIRQKPVQIDGSLTLNEEIQNAIDSLKRLPESEPVEQVNFNPNYLSDFQGYRLGLSPIVMDTIRSFRKAGGYFRSMDQFRRVAGLHDSTAERITHMLRFPIAMIKPEGKVRGKPKIRDLNAATIEDLRAIAGIGPVLSERIIKFRKALGGFLAEDQLYDVYGLDSAVVGRLLKRYRVLQKADVEKIDINSARVEELAGNVYITWDMAREIVAYRNRIKRYTSWEDLEQVEAVPKHRIARIRLYLSLEKKLHE